MKNEFWLQKWQDKQIGFHKNSVHPMLIKHCDELSLVNGNTIFVPLCGKTIDMLWLHQQGYKVIGNELSQIAVEEFFTGNKLDFTKRKQGHFTIYQHKEIIIYQGDFFKLNKNHLQNVNATYDRAALIALTGKLQNRYILHLNTIIPNNHPTLLITLEFNHSSGPPFSTTKHMIKKLFPTKVLTTLSFQNIIAEMPNYKTLGCDVVIEKTYLITPQLC